VSRCQKNLFLDFMVQDMEIAELDTPPIRLGATPSRLISSPHPSPIFALDALSTATLPIYPGLGQAPNVLACIPSVLVKRYMYSALKS